MKIQKEPEEPEGDFRPARRSPQAPQACANAAPAPLRGEPLQCTKRAHRTSSGMTQQRVTAIWPVFPRFAPGAADRWCMPGAPAAGSWSAVFPTRPLSCASVCPGHAARSKPQARSAEKQVVPLAPAAAPIARAGSPPVLSTAAAHPEGGCGLGRVAWAHTCAQAQSLAIRPARTGPRVHHTRRA